VIREGTKDMNWKEWLLCIASGVSIGVLAICIGANLRNAKHAEKRRDAKILAEAIAEAFRSNRVEVEAK
jgi:hypothetical protein